jgi:hypothetical protein
MPGTQPEGRGESIKQKRTEVIISYIEATKTVAGIMTMTKTMGTMMMKMLTGTW